jgi:hypothetical protein
VSVPGGIVRLWICVGVWAGVRCCRGVTPRGVAACRLACVPWVLVTDKVVSDCVAC